jgi:hypothetical protein
MKKIVICLGILALACIAVPASAQTNAQYCFGSPVTCQYLADTGLELGTAYWDYSAGSGPAIVTDPCAWGGGTSAAANLEPGDSVFQSFTTDSFSLPVWTIRLDLYKTSTYSTYNDYFTIWIHNYTTNQTEYRYVTAWDTPGLCGSVLSFDLDHDYTNSTVRVRIQKSYGATATMYVDNVAFFGRSS